MADRWEALVGPAIVVDLQVMRDHAIVVRNEHIEAVVPISQLPSDITIRHFGSGFLTAGLVDIHAHGAAGCGFNEGDIAGNAQALATLLQAGVTTVLPTLATAPIENMTKGLEALSAVQGVSGFPHIPGAHLEGPFFAQAQCGAQDPASLQVPSDGTLDRLLEYSDIIQMISFAPELPDAVALTERLVAEGIVAAAGHSDGRAEDLFACQRVGLSHIIHVFSGQSTTIREGPWRHPGLLEATLASDELTVEMIGDGKHLDSVLMKMAHRCLGDRLCLVSDSTPGAGMADGSRYRMGEIEYIVEDGVGMTLDRSAFAGSTTFVSAMIPIVISALGISLAEAVAMATSIPAKAARLCDVGRIAKGFRADFTLFDARMGVRAVALWGEWK